MTIGLVLVVLALLLTIAAGVDGRIPLWVAVLLLCLAFLVVLLPGGGAIRG